MTSPASIRCGQHVLLGALLAPLPMVIFWLAAVALMVGISWTIVFFGVIGYLLVWVPLLVSRGLLRLVSWSSLEAHLGVMFTATFLPLLSVYKFAEFNPDITFSYEINDNTPQVVKFAPTSVVIAALVALVNMACISIYGNIAVRYLAEATIADSRPQA